MYYLLLVYNNRYRYFLFSWLLVSENQLSEINITNLLLFDSLNRRNWRMLAVTQSRTRKQGVDLVVLPYMVNEQFT